MLVTNGTLQTVLLTICTIKLLKLRKAWKTSLKIRFFRIFRKPASGVSSFTDGEPARLAPLKVDMEVEKE